ncbi:MAG: hypothetical protein AB8B55_13805 [Mariniblastus sp.]
MLSKRSSTGYLSRAARTANVVACFAIACCIWVAPVSGQDDLETPAQKFQKRMAEVQRKSQESLGNQMMLSRLTGLTYNTELMKEMEILGEQREQLQQISKDFHKELGEAQLGMMKLQAKLQEHRAAGETEKIQEIAIQIQSATSKVVDANISKVEEVLLPHQMERMNQLSLQQSAKIQSEHIGFIGLPLAVADRLELTKEEKNKLRDVTERVDDEFREELARLNKEKMKEVLDALSPEKQELFRQLVGDIYDTENASEKMRNERREKLKEQKKRSQEKLR